MEVNLNNRECNLLISSIKSEMREVNKLISLTSDNENKKELGMRNKELIKLITKLERGK